MDQLRAVRAFLRSFVRRDWTLADYPVKVFERGVFSAEGRMRPFTWTAQIVNWWHMRGDGYSRDEALEVLRVEFDEFKAANPLPRPGRGAELKITFASSDRVERYRETADRLVESLFALAPSECFVSDESTLWDFHQEESNNRFIAAIRQRFGIDITDIDPPTIWVIAQRIDEERHGT